MQKMFDRIHLVRKERGIEGTVATARAQDEEIDEHGRIRPKGKEMEHDLIDFKWSMSGNFTHDQLQVINLLDRLSKEVELYEEARIGKV